ncbi:DUF294 nucleotidyltransferase-like domain-containing protein [Algihabitans albus]|uniref:DUF294 nucleotidyltransferase-like domain-containing protein n=1 Tax=Algihabitans albus TaxID=2164067 RepID=UPI000E5CBAFB|nr:DUF294 nucleotidyltransferase-like domain-containing protein [Algihabitans albus]
MDVEASETADFLASVHPYDSLLPDELTRVAAAFRQVECEAGSNIYALGQRLEGLYIIAEGRVDVRDRNGAVVSILGPRNSFGERGLLRDGAAATTAVAQSATRLLLLPAEEFRRLIAARPAFARFFDRSRPTENRAPDLATTRIADLMTPGPVTCPPSATVAEVARTMRDRQVSCLLVMQETQLTGIVTNRDLVKRALAEGLSTDAPVTGVMTADPITLAPDALGSDVLHAMLERRIGHLPVVDGERVIGVVTQTDLTRHQAISSAHLVREIADAEDSQALALVVGRIPDLLAQLVGAGNPHWVVTRLITDIADAATRRLLRLAEERLGPPPVPYLWLACGSQGRQEQTGVSDQDNCLFLSENAIPEHDSYFEALARFVSDGLDACGYYYCPGEMMATTARWRQPVQVWRNYFSGWIRKPDPMAQMLASVMFDLRPIGGEVSLFRDVMSETLALAATNSIFVAHMVANALNHAPPLGLLRGFATIRSGEHKDTLDLKLNGVVPVVDLGRIYAIQGRLQAANTRTRLEVAQQSGIVSPSGGRDLIAAYDLIAETRLRHQVARVRTGEKPDNFMSPAALSDFERSHLRDAFVVVKTMQSAIAHGRAAVL